MNGEVRNIIVSEGVVDEAARRPVRVLRTLKRIGVRGKVEGVDERVIEVLTYRELMTRADRRQGDPAERRGGSELGFAEKIKGRDFLYARISLE